MGLGMRGVWRWVWMGAIVGLASCGAPTDLSEESGTESVEPTTEAAVEADLPIVVATSSVLCDLTGQIAAETIALTCLLEPGQDPHTYAATPSDRRAIDSADLILYDGYNLSAEIQQMVEASQNSAPKVAVFEAAVPEPLMGMGHDHDHDHGEDAHSHEHDHGEDAHAHDHDHEAAAADDHAHDHDHDHGEAEGQAGTTAAEQVPDPHVWHSAANGAAIAQVIGDQLGAIAPDEAALYASNTERVVAQLTQLHDWIGEQTSTVPAGQRKLVTPHDAFRYFADAYDFSVAATLSGLSMETEISATTIIDLVEQVKAANVPAIFAETTTNPKNIEVVAQDADVAVAPQALFVEGPAGEGTPAPNYQTMLVVNTCTIVNALGGTCDQEQAPL